MSKYYNVNLYVNNEIISKDQTDQEKYSDYLSQLNKLAKIKNQNIYRSVSNPFEGVMLSVTPLAHNWLDLQKWFEGKGHILKSNIVIKQNMFGIFDLATGFSLPQRKKNKPLNNEELEIKKCFGRFCYVLTKDINSHNEITKSQAEIYMEKNRDKESPLSHEIKVVREKGRVLVLKSMLGHRK